MNDIIFLSEQGFLIGWFMMLEVLFFLLPFFLYSGVFFQAVSFYLFLILIPCFLMISMKKEIPLFFSHIAFIFLGLFFVFPLNDILIYFFHNDHLSHFYLWPHQWPGPFQSSFPSSLFVAGILLLIFRKISIVQKLQNTQKINECSSNQVSPLSSFFKGLFWSSLVFILLLFYQFLTGFELKSLFHKHISYLGPNDHFGGTAFYRCYGFYGHPLTLSAVSLAYGTFVWSLICSSFIFFKGQILNFFPNKKSLKISYFMFLVIFILNFIALLLTGGRTATLVGFIFFLLIPFVFLLKKGGFKWKIIFFLGAVPAVLFCLMAFFGLMGRFYETTHAIQNESSIANVNNRIYFWKIYWSLFLDSPIRGQGHYWLDHGIRDFYYNHEGLAYLTEKFKAHNMILEILGSVGLLGLGILSFLIYKMHRVLKVIFMEKNLSQSFLYISFLWMFIANCFHGLTQNVFFDSSVVYIYISILMLMLWQNLEEK